jgi:y4mF family transcriptional regulator
MIAQPPAEVEGVEDTADWETRDFRRVFYTSTGIISAKAPYLYHIGYIILQAIAFAPERVYYAWDMDGTNPLGRFVKEQRRAAGLTQEEFALRSGLGLRFIRDLEQGKETVRLDNVNQALAMFGYHAVPGRIPR